MITEEIYKRFLDIFLFWAVPLSFALSVPLLLVLQIVKHLCKKANRGKRGVNDG